MMSNQETEESQELSVQEQMERAWALSGANQPVSPEEAEAAKERLTDYDFMSVVELEQIVGLTDRKSPEYRGAMAALVKRAEYKPEHSGGRFYQGNALVRPSGSDGR